MEARVAAIDIGTVSSRCALATVRDGRILSLEKRTVITDLGEGVDATGRLSDAAIARVVDACREFTAEIAAFKPAGTCTTCTSAARDAENGDALLTGLRGLGLRPQVIPGEVEARLTFFGVAREFPHRRIAVADSGGGSTEIACGSFEPQRVDASRAAAPGSGAAGAAAKALDLDAVESLDIGSRRVTDRFFSPYPPVPSQLGEASAFAHELFRAYWARFTGERRRPDELVAVGGTVTTLVAMLEGLVEYDSSRVHLHRLSLAEVGEVVERLQGLTVSEIAAMPGIQPKRAPVILGGAVTIRELMCAGGYGELTVSESSLLAGMAVAVYETISGGQTSIGWIPELS